MGVVIWIQDNDTEEILQSAYASNTIGIAEGKLNSFNLFPNPAKENVSIRFKENTTVADIFIYSIEGKEVFKGANTTIENDIFSFSTSEFKTGIYIIKVMIAGQVLMKKLVIE